MHFETKIIIDNIADSIINQHLCIFAVGATADANKYHVVRFIKTRIGFIR